MRDPLAPLPSPACDPGFWRTTTTPRATRLPPPLRDALADATEEFSPLRLLGRDCGDTHGIDRRVASRKNIPESTEGRAVTAPGHGTGRVLSASHRRFDQVLGLSTCHGWALVRTLSRAPAGLLLHHLDLLDPRLPAGLRARGQALLRRLLPRLGAPLRPTAVHAAGSPLEIVGGCLLAARVVADLSAFASQPVPRRGISKQRPATLTVSLLAAVAGEDAALVAVEAELVPMTDPQSHILAAALSPRAMAELERAAGKTVA